MSIGVRTPVGNHGGALRSLLARDLLTLVFKGILERTKIDPASIDEVLAGCIAQPSDAPNIARVSALLAGIPYGFHAGKAPPWYEKGPSCGIDLSGVAARSMGQLSPEVQRGLDLGSESVYLLELDGTMLLKSIAGGKPYEPLARFPAVLRDLSFVLGRQIESATLCEIIKREGGDLAESVILFDVYEGGKIAPSEKALAFRICYRSKEGTLDGKEVNRLHEAVIARIGKETGGRLREG